uniref:N-acetyltransferase domain-containing protein n=1 Tax=Fundulus heteroclitus TaxID=8078 RepID=A0A3Q2NUN6_FUNHE
MFSIREYKPSDEHVVMSLFHDGILEHVYPAFFKAMSNPDHIGIALSISMAGYVLGGSSYFQALLFGSLWAGLIYYCCHDIYNSYMMGRLSTDMADIQASYLENPDNGFWVAEADVNGQAKVVGMVAVVGALDFCKERGFSRLVVDLSSPQTAAICMCQKLELFVPPLLLHLKLFSTFEIVFIQPTCLP